MKKILAFILIFVISNLAFASLEPNTPSYAGDRTPISTVQQKAKVVATVTADAAALSTTTSDWGHCVTLFEKIPPEWNIVDLEFYGYGDGDGAGSPANATFSYDVHLVDLYSGAVTVSTGNTGIIGAQQMSHNPATGTALNAGSVSTSYCWADTLTAGTTIPGWTVQFWDNLGGDRKASTSFDRRKAYGIHVRIYNMTEQSVTSITCIMNGY